MATTNVVAALAEVLCASARASPLNALARPKYPAREFQPYIAPDGALVLTLYKWGYEYKHRGPRPKTPPCVDTEAIRAILNAKLSPRYTITAIEDNREKLIIKLKEEIICLPF